MNPNDMTRLKGSEFQERRDEANDRYQKRKLAEEKILEENARQHQEKISDEYAVFMKKMLDHQGE